MCRAIVYASREPDIRYWADRHWERMFLHNTTFELDGVNGIDARTLWHYQAIVVSPNLISTTPGTGTAYLTTFRDSENRFLDGGRHYVLPVPADHPSSGSGRSRRTTRPPGACWTSAATPTRRSAASTIRR